MNIKNILLGFVCVIALRADAAMVRVQQVVDGRTLIVEHKGNAETITLAGIDIVDDKSARTLLEWTLVARWISLESVEGGHLAYRSPDALFVNRELVTRGFARATLPDIEPPRTVPVTYLGTLDLPGPRPTTTAARTAPSARSDNAPTTRRRASPRPSPRRGR
jgi:hypothetical protein